MRVGVASRLAEGADRDEHPWAGKIASVDGHPYTCGGTGCVAHCGETCLQCLAGCPYSPHELEGRRGGELTSKVEPFAERGEVHMAIDEPGEDGQAGGIDLLRIARRVDGRTPRRMRDPSVFYDNDRFAHRLPSGRVEEAASVDSPNHCPMLVLSKGSPAPGLRRA